ncbi:MAG: PRC-barrel domain containing protein [Opitutaceae bacterium]|nr:PRC-barrel domain containing protein [Opitutaceae bacterium]
MFQDLNHLYGKKLSATDGILGEVRDFYFDDQSWAIRYLVADTGPWLAGRQVLLSPHAFDRQALGRADAETDVLHVTLTRKQIEGSPSIDTHRPVSRQYEEDYYRYYGWPIYWEGGGIWGASGFPTLTLPTTPENRPHHGHNQRDDVHLRSTKAITGYRVQAADGPVGSVTGFMVEGWSWGLR